MRGKQACYPSQKVCLIFVHECAFALSSMPCLLRILQSKVVAQIPVDAGAERPVTRDRSGRFLVFGTIATTCVHVYCPVSQ